VTGPHEALSGLREPWEAKAACRALEAAARADFFEESVEASRRARAVCRRCPVRLDCLWVATRTDQEYGIWGGTTRLQRVAMRDGLVRPTPS
jgi:WhiB family redox-sensing transcriptional regulator